MNCTDQKSDSLAFITWMQVIGCALVILGHSYPFIAEIPAWALQLRLFIYDFHMPLFVWCSGYLVAGTGQSAKYTFGGYCRTRVIRILIPYFAFSAIGIVPKILFSGILNDNLHADLFEIIRVFLVPRASIWGHFWFLPMIFVLGILGYGILKLENRKRYASTLLLPVGLIGFFAPALTGWLALDDIVHYFFYFVYGIVCARSNLKWDNGRTLPAGIICTAIGVTLFLTTPHGLLIKFLISVFMLNAVWMISQLICRKYPLDRTAAYAQTYSIFILAWPCQLAAEVVLERLFGMPFQVVFPCMIVTGLVAPIIIIELVTFFEQKTKTKIISCVIGK